MEDQSFALRRFPSEKVPACPGSDLPKPQKRPNKKVPTGSHEIHHWISHINSFNLHALVGSNGRGYHTVDSAHAPKKTTLLPSPGLAPDQVATPHARPVRTGPKPPHVHLPLHGTPSGLCRERAPKLSPFWRPAPNAETFLGGKA